MRSVFQAPLCLRKGPEDNGEGFFIVETGIIVVNHETKIMDIYEKEMFDCSPPAFFPPPLLSIPLENSSTHGIDLQKIRSEHDNFRGGRVRITGFFDRDMYETVTIKMYLFEFNRFGRVLKRLGI